MAFDIRHEDTPVWGSGQGFRGAELTLADNEEFSPSVGGTRSECYEALQQQIRTAEVTQSFVFAHRRLDGVAALALTQYLRDDCKARFVDLSFLGNWEKACSAAAGALGKGLRCLRSLTLDGNALGSHDAWETWCEALEEHPGLQHISLRECQLDDHCAVRLAQVLRHHSLLFSLDLGCTGISDFGVMSLVEALDENNVLLELCVEGTRSSEEARAALQKALDRNRSLYRGQKGIPELLRGLRRARAEAVTADAQLSNSAASCCQVPEGGALPSKPSASLEAKTPAAVSDLARGASFFSPSEYAEAEHAREVPSAEQTAADAVWFDAPDGRALLQELTLRCEAGWRYSAADQEEMLALRGMVTDLQAVREKERARHQEALERIVAVQSEFRQRVLPVETRMAELREELDAQAGVASASFRQNVELKVQLRAAQDALEVAGEELAQTKLGAQKLESGLKLRHREAAEKAQQLEQDIASVEAATTSLEEDNERCRGRLHALRFETETERFVPHAVVARLSQQLMSQQPAAAQTAASGA